MARFKKKEDIERMTKSILKHKIQTLTGKSIKTLEEEMDYRPKNPDEPSMDIDTMRRLASSLVLLATNELPDYPAPAPAPVQVGSKRSAPAGESGGSARKVSRRSMAVATSSSEAVTNGSAKKPSRRSVAAIPSNGSLLQTPGRRTRKSEMNNTVASGVSSVSQSVTNCLGPDKDLAEHLASVEEDEEKDETLANPTPHMKELIKKRKSVAPTVNTPKKSPVKKAASKAGASKAKVSSVSSDEGSQPGAIVRPASPPPRQDFPGPDRNKVYLVSGDPMDLKLSKIISTLPLSAQFSGAQLTVVHTPADWTPTEIFLVTKHIKMMNKEAGLESFVVLVGTGLSNVHMNIEALSRHTKHVQFVTFHREDANKGLETGKLRETTSFFLASYFFPGCEKEGSTLPTKMVRDGYTTCFRTEV